MPKATRPSAQYIALALFFAFAATYQTRFLISESMNAADEEWGEEEVVATAKGCRHRPAVEIRDVLIAGAEAFAAGTPQHDDMTVVVLKIGDSDRQPS